MTKCKKRLQTIVTYVVGILVAMITVYPIIYTVLFGLKSPEEAISSQAYEFPSKLYWGNYAYILKESQFPRYFLNSVVITGSVTVVVLIVTSMAAFALAKMRIRGKHHLQMYFLLGLMIPMQVCLLPLYQTFAKLGITDQYLGVILPQVAFGIPLSVYLFVNFFRFFPDDIIEAGIIDGCGTFWLFGVIVIPMSRNILLTLAMLRAVYSWNDFLFPYTFTRSRKLQTITLGLRDFVGAYGYTDWGRTFAAVSITILPMIVIYFFLGKYMVAGMSEGAVKG